MANNYLQDVLARVVAMQLEALAEGVVDANSPPLLVSKPYWPYQQEDFPYMSNRLGTGVPEEDKYSEEIESIERPILMRLVVDHLTAGFQGDKANLLVDYIPLVRKYFREHPMLTTNTGPFTIQPDFLFYEAEIGTDTGIVIFTNAGLPPFQLGVEFTLVTNFLREGDIA